MDILTLLIVLAAGIAAEQLIVKRAQNRAEFEDEVTNRLVAYTLRKTE
jgi:hypothetical protein